jgi:hypothetical protein
MVLHRRPSDVACIGNQRRRNGGLPATQKPQEKQYLSTIIEDFVVGGTNQSKKGGLGLGRNKLNFFSGEGEGSRVIKRTDV